MRETPSQPSPTNAPHPSTTVGHSKAGQRPTIELRREAIRRWIDDDDDSACRGID